MTIEEAIEHCEEVTARESKNDECRECAMEHQQLDKWLRELLELRAHRTTIKLDRTQWEGCNRCKKSCQNCADLRNCCHSMPTDLACWKGIAGRMAYCSWCGRPLTEEAWAELERRINNGTTD